MSRDTTFEEDTSDQELILKTLDTLSEDVYRQLTESNFSFKTGTIKVRYSNFKTHTHGKTLPFPTNRVRDIKKISRELMQPYLKTGRKVRLVGVRLSNLVSTEKQKTLI